MKKIITVLLLLLVVCGFIVLIVNSFSTVTNEKNYYANGSKLNIPFYINIHYISQEISDINDSLIKEISCGDILQTLTKCNTASFNGCDSLTVIAAFEIYDNEQRYFFKDYEIITLTQNQINSLRNNKDQIKLHFNRNIQVTFYLADSVINNPNTITAIKNDNQKIPVNIFLKKNRNTIRLYKNEYVAIIGKSTSVVNGKKFSITSKPQIIYAMTTHYGDYTLFN
jgi:hypothetical protein